jgi:hypothetical protein
VWGNKVSKNGDQTHADKDKQTDYGTAIFAKIEPEFGQRRPPFGWSGGVQVRTGF